MTTFKRSEYPDFAEFLLALRNNEPKIAATIGSFIIDKKDATEQGEPWQDSKPND